MRRPLVVLNSRPGGDAGRTRDDAPEHRFASRDQTAEAAHHDRTNKKICIHRRQGVAESTTPLSPFSAGYRRPVNAASRSFSTRITRPASQAGPASRSRFDIGYGSVNTHRENRVRRAVECSCRCDDGSLDRAGRVRMASDRDAIVQGWQIALPFGVWKTSECNIAPDRTN